MYYPGLRCNHRIYITTCENSEFINHRFVVHLQRQVQALATNYTTLPDVCTFSIAVIATFSTTALRCKDDTAKVQGRHRKVQGRHSKSARTTQPARESPVVHRLLVVRLQRPEARGQGGENCALDIAVNCNTQGTPRTSTSISAFSVATTMPLNTGTERRLRISKPICRRKRH